MLFGPRSIIVVAKAIKKGQYWSDQPMLKLYHRHECSCWKRTGKTVWLVAGNTTVSYVNNETQKCNSILNFNRVNDNSSGNHQNFIKYIQKDMQLLTDPFLNFPRFCNGSQVTHCHGHSSQEFTMIIPHPVVGGRPHQIEEGTSLP